MPTDTIIQKVVEFTTPAQCLVCLAEPLILCKNCASTVLQSVAAYCVVCGLARRQGKTCDDCATLTPLASLQAVTAYDDIGKQLIHHFKFEGDQQAARIAASLMATLVEAGRYDAVVAVTTTAARRRQRGYDQSVLLAKSIAKRLDITYLATLVRIKSVHQIGAGRELRLAQSKGLYVATKRIKGRILLIDDVVTTGATLSAAAEALTQAGATAVEALVFARDELT